MNAEYEPLLKMIRLQRDAESDSYAFSLPSVRHLRELKLTKPVTFFAGENGTGKSTLMEAVALAYGFNAEGGSRNFHFASKETHSDLYRSLLLGKGTKKARDGFFLRAESFYNVATEVDRLQVDDYYGGKSLHSQSHGESFLSLMFERFGGGGLYLLDEPEAALSVQSQLAFLGRLDALVNMQSQFLIATHSPILLAYPDAEIYVFSEDGIKRTSYEQTDAYILTKQFVNNPQQMMRYLFET
ncbi:MAG: AAA family ATPase [Anaerofustis sp.]